MWRSGSPGVCGIRALPFPGGNRSRERMLRDLLEPKGIEDVLAVILTRIHQRYWSGAETGGCETGVGDVEDCGGATGPTTGVLSRCFSPTGPGCCRLAS